MISLTFENSVGSGAGYPIKLTNTADTGEPERMGWAISVADPDLIKQSISSILLYKVTERFRQETFGTRIWEVLEEPNTPAAAFLLRRYIIDGIAAWEPRVTLRNVEMVQKDSTIHVLLTYQINNITNIYTLDFAYNVLTENSNI